MPNLKNISTLKNRNQVANDLFRLYIDNPDLPILVAVDSEIVVADDFYSWWLGSFSKAWIDEIVETEDNGLVIRSEHSDEWIYEELFYNDKDFNFQATDQQIKDKADGLPWLRCIIINISLPDFSPPNIAKIP